jgi:hypothetical protein
MDGGNEQRVGIKFCFKVGLSVTENTSIGAEGLWQLDSKMFLAGILDFDTEFLRQETLIIFFSTLKAQ